MQTLELTKQNRGKLLVKYLIPTILSNLSIFILTIIDGIFVGQGVGVDALGAINLIFPVVMLFNAVIMLVTIGGLTIAAIRIGRGEKESANQVFMHSFVLALIISVLFWVAAVFLTEPICRLVGANDTFLELAKDYIFWLGMFFIPAGLMVNLNGFCRNDGRPGLVSAAVIILSALNIFGDWLCIFPLQMGIKGAALATGVSEVVAFLIVLSHFVLKKGSMRFQKFQVQWRLVKKMIIHGLPECIAQFCTPLTTILTNLMLVDMLGDSAVNAYSIICYVACFSAAIFTGTAEGMQPLYGQCYGAGKERELRFYKHIGILIGGVGSAIVTGIILLLSGPICTLYAADPATMAVTMHAFPLNSWGFIMQAFNVVISAYLYSTTRSTQAIIINVLRSFVVNVLVVLFLPRLLGPESIWLTFGIYEAIVLVVGIILMQAADRKGVIQQNRE